MDKQKCSRVVVMVALRKSIHMSWHSERKCSKMTSQTSTIDFPNCRGKGRLHLFGCQCSDSEAKFAKTLVSFDVCFWLIYLFIDLSFNFLSVHVYIQLFINMSLYIFCPGKCRFREEIVYPLRDFLADWTTSTMVQLYLQSTSHPTSSFQTSTFFSSNNFWFNS